MSRRAPRRSLADRLPARLLSAGLMALVVIGYGYIILAEPGRSSRAAQLITPTGPAAPSPTTVPPTVPPAVPVARPVRVSITSIGLDSPLESLGLLPDGTLQPPANYSEAGWYAKGVLPGAVGPAVIAGHVDSKAGPAVFFRLRDLRIGDVITVRRQDRSVVRFEIDDVHAYAKNQFPTEAVYGPTAVPVLRLITCTGDFDAQAGSYLQNLVVSAHLI